LDRNTGERALFRKKTDFSENTEESGETPLAVVWSDRRDSGLPEAHTKT